MAKLVLLTGGSRGLGENTAIKLAQNGFDLIITYQKQKEEALNVVRKIESFGQKAEALALDLSNISSFDSFFIQAQIVMKSKFNTNRFDYLVNNAGIGFNVLFKDTSEEQFDLLMNVQFKGVFFFTQKALNYLNDDGGIVNISSRLAQASMPGYSAYASMKGAIETLTRYQAKELSVRGIKVNSIAPGPIETDFAGGVIRDNVHYNANVKSATALGRVGTPDDIGGVVAFLCSEAAKWITAQRIEVSGGMNL